MAKRIGKKIRSLRRAKHCTQSELAAVAGVSVQAVSKWECGGTPDIDLLPRIADFFGVSIDSLYGRSFDPQAPIEGQVFEAVANHTEARRVDRCFDLQWAAFKGLAGLPGIESLGYAKEGQANQDCTRAYVNFEEGMAYLCAEEGGRSLFFMPEPSGGYQSLLDDAEAYQSFFARLGQPYVMRFFFFLLERSELPFSAAFAGKSLRIPADEMDVLLQSFVHEGWIQREYVELDTGAREIYRPVPMLPFIPMLYYASELFRPVQLWYLSHAKRKRPFFDREKSPSG